MDLGVEGIMVAPGYSYDKAPDQQHFMGRARTRRTFKAILSNRKKKWQFNQSPLYLEFLMASANTIARPGHAHLQPLRLAEALLPAAGWLCRHFAELMETRPGSSMELNPGIRSAPIAWCIAALSHRLFMTVFFSARVRCHGAFVSVHRLPRSRRRAVTTGTGEASSRPQSLCEYSAGNTSQRNPASMSEPEISNIANPEILEVVPGFSHDQLEGWIPQLATEEEIRGALEKAFDYAVMSPSRSRTARRWKATSSTGKTALHWPIRAFGFFPRTTIRSFRFLIRKSRRWHSLDETQPRARVGKPGCENIGRRRPPVSTTSSVSPRPLSSNGGRP